MLHSNQLRAMDCSPLSDPC